MSDAEKKLWAALRRKQIGGLRFRRQFPLGPYFGDFVCFPARLVVEVDGSQHAEEATARYDAARTAWLKNENFRVLRFWNSDVLQNLDAVLQTIDTAVCAAPLPLTPSRKGRGKKGASTHASD